MYKFKSLLIVALTLSCQEQSFETRDSQGNLEQEQVLPANPEIAEEVQEAPSEEEELVLNREFLPAMCQKDGDGNCYLVDTQIEEMSGLIASASNQGLYWVHNDGGDPTVYGINLMGEIVARLVLPDDSNLDWEDIDIYRDPITEKMMIYQGDIGDGGKDAGEVYVYIFEEVQVDLTQRNQEILINNPRKVTLNYDSEDVFDFESLMVDPLNGDLFLIRKGSPSLYRAAGEQIAQNDTVNLNLVLNAGNWTSVASAADISPNGKEIVIRDEENVFIYSRLPNEEITDALGKTPVKIAVSNEFNGEAISFSADGLDFLTGSENKDADVDSHPISIYKRKPSS